MIALYKRRLISGCGCRPLLGAFWTLPSGLPEVTLCAIAATCAWQQRPEAPDSFDSWQHPMLPKAWNWLHQCTPDRGRPTAAVVCSRMGIQVRHASNAAHMDSTSCLD